MIVKCRLDTKLKVREENGIIFINDIVVFRDLPLPGSIRVYAPPMVVKNSISLFNRTPIVAPSHIDESEIPSHTIGFFTNAFGDGNDDKLMANGEIEANKIKSDYPILYNKIMSGEPVNGSIEYEFNGLRMDGNYKGMPFDYLVIEILRVNHYAMLQDELGACNIYQGCGFNVSATKTKEAKMPDLDLTGLAVEIGVMKSQVATIQANQTQFKPAICERDFSDLVGRVTAAEGLNAKLNTSYDNLVLDWKKVTDENSQLKQSIDELKAEVGTLKAAQTMQKNNNTGAKVEASEGDSDQEWGF